MGKCVDLIGQKFNHLLVLEKTDQKSGTNVLWKCQCDCGNITLASSSVLKSGHKKSCGCIHSKQRRALGKSKKKDLLNQVFGKLTVIEETDKREDGRVVWKCKCFCGNIIEVKSSDLLSGNKTHCGCLTKKSKGEEKIVKLLNELGLPYVREKRFKDLRYNGKALRYDFYVNNSYLIEFDGKQHFIKDTGYGRDLENIQKRDKIKNEYALNNNITLLRIPYTFLQEFSKKDLLESSRFKIVDNKKGGKL